MHFFPQIYLSKLENTVNYKTGRTAQIRLNNITGPRFPLRSGVPQGGVLSPTLYIVYTADMPVPGNNCIDVAFADDVTQIIQNFNNNKEQLAEDTGREIERINNYEKMWKIQTNITKFSLLSISKWRPHQVTAEGRNINFKNEVKILGLTLKRTGSVQHLTNRINYAKAQTAKLRRFKKLETAVKMRLYKTMIRPILEYPVMPNSLASKTQQLKMQKIQNRNLRFITCNDENLRNLTIEEKHHQLNIETINERLHSRLQKSWERFAIREPEIYDKSMRENNDNFRDHAWWGRAALRYIEAPQDLIYT